MNKKYLLLCGAWASGVYVLTVILGGFLWAGYSHIEQPVSDLIAAGAPNKPLLDSFFALYNLLTIAFGLGLLQLVRRDQQNRRQLVGTFGALVLIAEGVFGICTLFFPEDAGGMASSVISNTGMMHIVFAGLTSVTTMLAILLMGFWFRTSTTLHQYGWYSFISVAIVFVTGGLAAMSISSHNGVGGLWERLTMSAWLQWMFIIGAMLYARLSAHRQIQF